MPANIVVPEVGESIVDARVAKWLRKEGDTVSAGDPLVELETDKVDLEVGAPQAGVLSRIDRKDGEDVKVGEVLGRVARGRERAGCRRSRASGEQGGSAVARNLRAEGEGQDAALDADRAQGRGTARSRSVAGSWQW